MTVNFYIITSQFISRICTNKIRSCITHSVYLNILQEMCNLRVTYFTMFDVVTRLHMILGFPGQWVWPFYLERYGLIHFVIHSWDFQKVLGTLSCSLLRVVDTTVLRMCGIPKVLNKFHKKKLVKFLQLIFVYLFGFFFSSLVLSLIHI